MIERAGLTRRHFLALGIAFVAPLLPSIVRPGGGGLGASAGPGIAASLPDVLGVPATARRVGEAYLAATPAEANVARLTSGVVGSLPRMPDLLIDVDAADLRAAIAEVIREDFRTERTVVIDGWILARTEARLYALAALA
jgi:hypothetical protein